MMNMKGIVGFTVIVVLWINMVICWAFQLGPYAAR